jgi:hypothetical protein
MWATGGTSGWTAKPKRWWSRTVNPAAEMAPSVSRLGWQPPGDPAPGRRHEVLGLSEQRVRGADMLVEGQGSAGPQDPLYFRKDCRLVGDAAQYEAYDDGVRSAAVGRDLFCGRGHDRDRDRG